MSQLETVIRDAATPDVFTADWDDVLRRAGHTSAFRSRRMVAIGALAAVVVVLLLPGIGVGGGLNALLSGSGPSLELRAPLSLADGRTIGTISVRSNRIFVAKGRRPRPFVVGRGHKSVLPPLPIRWSLDLEDATARSAKIVNSKGQVLSRLCAPCSDGAHGTAKAPARAVAGIFGRAVAVVETGGGTARGTLRLVAPR